MKRLCHFNKSLLTRGHVARLSRPPPSLYILLDPHTVCVPIWDPHANPLTIIMATRADRQFDRGMRDMDGDREHTRFIIDLIQ